MKEKKEESRNDHLCTVGHLRFVDNFLRRMVHNPKKLFGQYTREGMTVIDIGCGGGFATLGLADMVGPRGKVIAADLQPEMLDITKKRLEKAGLSERVVFHKCQPDRIDYNGWAGFALAFFMLHETNNIPGFIKEIYEILEDGGLFYISEPSFHVTQEEFEYTIGEAKKVGFQVRSFPKIIFGRTVLLKKSE